MCTVIGCNNPGRNNNAPCNMHYLRMRRTGKLHIETVLERFEKFILVTPGYSCHIWTGYIDYKGYGSFVYRGSSRRSHRVAWELYKGIIPKGLFVLHKCDTRNCVNVDHLFLGTAKDNTADMVKKGRDNFAGRRG